MDKTGTATGKRMAFTIEQIRDGVRGGAYFISGHGDRERLNDGLTIIEIEQAVANGVILEAYPDTGRGESCLVAGFTSAGKPIHIIFGRHGEQLVVITVYLPKPPKFITPYQRGEK